MALSDLFEFYLLRSTGDPHPVLDLKSLPPYTLNTRGGDQGSERERERERENENPVP